MKKENPEQLARQLEQHEDYRVIRRLGVIDSYNEDDPELRASGALRQGIFLDVETTGLDASTEQVIELAMIPFEFASDGRIFGVGDGYNGLRDPGVPIPEEISRLTGITDSMVAGQALDNARIEALLEPAHLIVAHNAGFDRPFAESLHPLFAARAWACSLAEVPWREEGLEGTKLDYLAYRFGFFYAAHRAADDCRAGINLLAQTLPTSGTGVLVSLLDSARRKTTRVWAEGSPYDSKDLLKARRYVWNPGDDGRPKAWYRDVDEPQLDAELDFLRQEVYGGRLPTLPMDTITAFNRYSVRV